MEWWERALLIAGGIGTLWGGFEAFKKFIAPYINLKKDVSGCKDWEKSHEEKSNERFKKLEEAQEQQKATTQAMLQGLVALVNHEIDGNGIQGLKEARAELLTHIINR